MVYNTQNHWVSGFGPSSGIPINQKTQCIGYWVCFHLQARGKGRETPALLSPSSKRVKLNHWTIQVFFSHRERERERETCTRTYVRAHTHTQRHAAAMTYTSTGAVATATAIKMATTTATT
jgi:hypothetical protein